MNPTTIFIGIACLFLASCTFPTEDGGTIVSRPGIFKDVPYGTPGGIQGVLTYKTAPPVVEVAPEK